VEQSPFLKIGTAWAIFQSLGTVPCSKDDLKLILNNISAEISLVSLSILALIPSGPVAMCTSSELNWLCIPFLQTLIFSITG